MAELHYLDLRLVLSHVGYVLFTPPFNTSSLLPVSTHASETSRLTSKPSNYTGRTTPPPPLPTPVGSETGGGYSLCSIWYVNTSQLRDSTRYRRRISLVYERLGGSGFYDCLISATLERGNWNKWTGLYYISLLARLDLYFLSCFNGNRSIVFYFFSSGHHWQHFGPPKSWDLV